MKFSEIKTVFAVIPMVSALALGGCGEPAETTYETDVVDESGGELIVSDVDRDAVPVDLPETEMVVVTEEEGGTAEE